MQEGQSFIGRNSHKAWAKLPDQRIEMPDYPERAVTEAIVNALIHRSYFELGSEVHIDMFDDRIELYSPGGMVDGTNIQDRDIMKVPSKRRNPVIADIFARLNYMERRGSGFKKIIEDYQFQPKYTDKVHPIFQSENDAFYLTLWNMNYVVDVQTTEVTTEVATEVTTEDTGLETIMNAIVEFCTEAKSRVEIMNHFGYSNEKHFRTMYIRPLLEKGLLKQTIPDKPNSRYQKYIKA